MNVMAVWTKKDYVESLNVPNSDLNPLDGRHCRPRAGDVLRIENVGNPMIPAKMPEIQQISCKRSKLEAMLFPATSTLSCSRLRRLCTNKACCAFNCQAAHLFRARSGAAGLPPSRHPPAYPPICVVLVAQGFAGFSRGLRELASAHNERSLSLREKHQTFANLFIRQVANCHRFSPLN
jgi:hypothetical protein